MPKQKGDRKKKKVIPKTSSTTPLKTTGDGSKKTTKTLKNIKSAKAVEKAKTAAGTAPRGRRKKQPTKETTKTTKTTTPRRKKATIAPPPVDVDTQGLGANARANKVFRDLLVDLPDHGITKTSYMTDLTTSMRDKRPIAYVVNIILPYSGASKILEVVEGIMAGAEDMDGRVAFVFGINGKLANAQELDEAWKAATTAIGGSARPIALVKDTFKTAKFPYGTMRNRVLQSKATADITKALYTNGNHPYVSIQDFDPDARTVPSGAHVFNHFADKLAGKDPLNPTQQIPIRPLMMSGGYRVGASTKMPSKGKHTMVRSELVKHVKEDMLTRAKLAQIHPLLPYSPEPNLFLDGTLLLAEGRRLAFGDGGAEFSALSKVLNGRFTDELGSLGVTSPEGSSDVILMEDEPETTTTVPTQDDETMGEAQPSQQTDPELLDEDAPPDTELDDDSTDMPVDEEEQDDQVSVDEDQESVGEESVDEEPVEPDPPEMFYEPEEGDEDDEDAFLTELDLIQQRTFVQGFAENVRHPVRGLPYLTDFIDGAIATDLTRLAATLEKGWNIKQQAHSKHKLPQSHVPPKPASDRIFSVKDTAKGTSLKGYGDAERGLDPLGIKIIEETPEVDTEEDDTDWTTVKPSVVNKDGMRRVVPGMTQIWAPTAKKLKPMVGSSPFVGTKDPEATGRTGKGDLGKKYDRLSGAVSGELQKPYAHVYTGITPSQTALSLHGVALSNPTRNTIRRLELLTGMLDSQDVPVATGTVLHAVAETLGKDSDALRKAVIAAAVTRVKAEDDLSFLVKQPITSFVVQKPMTDGDFSVALSQNRTRLVPKPTRPDSSLPTFLPGDTANEKNAHELSMRLLANHLKRPIHIHGADGVTKFEPFDVATSTRPVRITDTVTIDTEGQERHIYSTRT